LKIGGETASPIQGSRLRKDDFKGKGGRHPPSQGKKTPTIPSPKRKKKKRFLAPPSLKNAHHKPHSH